jgi:hypothetical protein
MPPNDSHDAEDYAGLPATPQDDASRDAAGDALGRDWRKMKPPGYTVITNVHTGAKSIRCDTCGLTSHNSNDVKNLYCGFCHRFHEAAR